MKVRLQRFMADCGVASRRECEDIIAAGRVRVNGQVRTDVPVMIDPAKDAVTVDEQSLEGGPGAELQQQDLVYYLLNKPKGILVTNYDPSERKTVGELMTGVKERVFPVGRLDMDSRGALIMTNDGELANRLTHPRHGVEKTYIVEVEGRMSPLEIEKMKRGLWLGPEHRQHGPIKSEPFRVKLVGRERGRTIMEIKLTEGKNSEIRRVMARLAHPVRDLNRVAIAGKVTIRGIEPGEFRKLTDEEVKWLFHASSKEYHDRERSATQQWYEQKEMAKERKRLAAEAKAVGGRKPVNKKPGFAARKGPPPRQFESRGTRGGPPRTAAQGPYRPKPFGPRKPAAPTRFTPQRPPETRGGHPLGDAARDDE